MTDPTILTAIFRGFCVPQNVLANNPQINQFIEELETKYKYDMHDRVYICIPRTFKVVKNGRSFIDSSDIEQGFIRISELVSFKYITNQHFYRTIDDEKLNVIYDQIKSLFTDTSTNTSADITEIKNLLVEGSTTCPESDSYPLYYDLELPIM